MTFGSKITDLRRKNNYSQEQLAEKLNVSRQTIYKWEADAAMPERDKLDRLVKIFNTSYDYLLNDSQSLPKKEDPVQTVENVTIPASAPAVQKAFVDKCNHCGKPVYSNENYHKMNKRLRVGRGTHYTPVILCESCYNKYKAKINSEKKARVDATVKKAVKRRKFSIIVLATMIIAAVLLGVFVNPFISVIVLLGPFCGCLILNNNKVSDVFLEIAQFGIISTPGVIFSLDIDGILFAIGFKIFAFLFSIFFGLAVIAFGVFISSIMAVFVYPFALMKNIEHPEIDNTIHIERKDYVEQV